MKSRTLLRFAMTVGTGLIVALIAAAVVIEGSALSPRLLGLYVERRLQGHGDAAEWLGRRVRALLVRADRGAAVPQLSFPAWAGASAAQGADAAVARAGGRRIDVASEAALTAALDQAQPGDLILIAPGRYRFAGRGLRVVRPGSAAQPITVAAPRLGTTVLEFDMLEGFHVQAPHWIFENLEIRGICARHDDCEHAFHVVGPARGVVIRRNLIVDFNAHVKINGHAGAFPDQGRVESNTLVNMAVRRTGNPVTPIDLVAASGWTFQGNLIADFVKGGGDQTSYGAFVKGGGADNVFAGNLVLCEHRLRGAPGRRVGLSFGGGGSTVSACRDGRCVVEHERGLMQNNVIASCSDVGIYVNRSAQSRVIHNTLLDTAGLLARFPESSAAVIANVIEGPLHARDGARIEDRDNLTSWQALSMIGVHPLRWRYRDATAVDLRWTSDPPRAAARAEREPDFCGAPRPGRAAYGAFESIAPCLAAGALAGR